ncbi:MAG: DUF362 domain-containing protein [Syntrophorhabdales bacterium]|jgi:hypothetical protein
MSKVFFTDMRARPDRNLLNKVESLLERMRVGRAFKKNDLVAIKLHFGELGNCAFLRPVFLRTIVEKVKSMGAQPFLTDTNTLYKGSRSNAISHLDTAVHNGFDYACVGCPIIIADGLRGANSVKVKVPGEVLKEVSIAREIAEADRMIAVTHFKLHELSGFGGALKNIGMGGASREGKLVQHSTLAPQVNVENCKGCKVCFDYCPVQAISLKQKRATIEGRICIGCGECIAICPEGAIEIQWTDDVDLFQKKMVEHACGVLQAKKNTIFLNFIMDVSPACDCYPCNDAPIVRDVGVLASFDPVSIDAASADLVNNEESLPGTVIKRTLKKGQDKFRAVYPSVDWNVQLDHAEKLGLGERSYMLVKV